MTMYRFPKPDPIDPRLTWRGLAVAIVLALFGWAALMATIWCMARIVGVL